MDIYMTLLTIVLCLLTFCIGVFVGQAYGKKQSPRRDGALAADERKTSIRV